jgi:hypothetical protein
MKPRDYRDCRDCVTVVTSEFKIVLIQTGNFFLGVPIPGASSFLRQSRRHDGHAVTRIYGIR